MASFLTIVKLLLSLGPDLIKFIQKLEDIIPGQGNGEKKLAMLRAFMESLWAGADNALPAFEEIWPKIQSVVSGIVAAFNAMGIFKK
jgi:hypothetical protein